MSRACLADRCKQGRGACPHPQACELPADAEYGFLRDLLIAAAVVIVVFAATGLIGFFAGMAWAIFF